MAMKDFYDLFSELINKLSQDKMAVEEIARETEKVLKKLRPQESDDLRGIVFFKCVEAMSHPIVAEHYETLAAGLRIKPPQFFTQEAQPRTDIPGEIIFWDAPEKTVRGWYVSDGINMFRT